MKKLIIILFLFFTVATVHLFSQSSDYDTLIPEEYTDDEFSQFFLDLRRFEVVTIGSYPFSVLFTKLGMDIYDAARGEAGAGSMFGGSANRVSTSSDTKKLLLTSLYVSLGIATVDFIIEKIKDKNKSANKNKSKNRK